MRDYTSSTLLGIKKIRLSSYAFDEGPGFRATEGVLSSFLLCASYGCACLGA